MTDHAPTTAPLASVTNWPGVFAATFAGVAAALQIGKVAASLPLIRADYAASLTLLSVYVVLLSIVGAIGGLAFGNLARRIGPRRVGLCGLLLIAAGSACAATAPVFALFLATRLMEAVGFALIITTMPAIIQGEAAGPGRGLALGVWATWLPLGIAVMMAISYFGIDPLGWRGIYMICAAVPVAAALLLAATTRPDSRVTLTGPIFSLRTLRDRETRLMAGIFLTFTAANLLLVSFLPTILVDTFAFSPASAALVAFAASIALLPANLAGGWLVGIGGNARLLFVLSLGGMLLSAILVLNPGFGAAACVAGAIANGLFSGLPPGMIWASLPRLVRQPGDAPLLSGTFFQAAGIGQVTGPLLGGLVVDATGTWSSALWVCGSLLLLSILAGLSLPGRHR